MKLDKENLMKKITLYAGIFAILGSIAFPFIPKPNNVQARRNEFNLTTLVDVDHDSIPDYAMESGFGGPTPNLCTYHWRRKPTKNEIELFKNGSFQDYGYSNKTFDKTGLYNLENILH